jgi:hypothetical protein
MVLAFRMVDNRCATINVVRPFINMVSASCTKYSDSASKPEVASSNNNIFDNGKIAESGSHTALLRLNGIYANLISKQSGPTKEKSKFSLGSVATPRTT